MSNRVRADAFRPGILRRAKCRRGPALMSSRSTLVAVELPHLDLATFVLYVGFGEGGRDVGEVEPHGLTA